jgi:hypothetical protein
VRARSRIFRSLIAAATFVAAAGAVSCGSQERVARSKADVRAPTATPRAQAAGAMRQPSRASLPSRRARWKRLPSLAAIASDPDGAQIVALDDAVYVTAVSRDGDGAKPNRLRVWRWTGRRWARPLGNRGLPLHRNTIVTALAGDRLCVIVRSDDSAPTLCLRGRRWQRVADELGSAGPYAHVSSVFAVGGRTFAIQQRRVDPKITPGGAGVEGRVEARMFEFTRSAWRDVGAGDLDPSIALGAQRPQGFEWQGRACVTYDAPPASRATPGEARFRCLVNGHWADAAPPLRAVKHSDVVNVDGVTASGATLFAGLAVFSGRHVDWPIWRLEAGRWQQTSLAPTRASWDEQGDLYEVAGNVWAFRFDQRMTKAGLRANLVVRAYDPSTGLARDVGAPLLRGRVVHGPVYYGIGSWKGDVYALVTEPDRNRQRNHLAAYRLHEPQSTR